MLPPKTSHHAKFHRDRSNQLGDRGCSEKKFPHTHIHTDTRHPDYLSRALQHAWGATKNLSLSKKPTINYKNSSYVCAYYLINNCSTCCKIMTEYLPDDLDKVTHGNRAGDEEFRLIKNRKLFFRVISFNDNLTDKKLKQLYNKTKNMFTIKSVLFINVLAHTKLAMKVEHKAKSDRTKMSKIR